MEIQSLVDEYNQTKSLSSQVHLLALGGSDVPEIAKILGISVAEVENILRNKEVKVNAQKEQALVEALKSNMTYAEIQKSTKASRQNIKEVRAKYNIPPRKTSGRPKKEAVNISIAPTPKSEDKSRAYYKVFQIETIDVIKSCLTKEEYIGFLKGNLIKYSLRAGFKTPDPADDLQKRNEYQKWLLKEITL